MTPDQQDALRQVHEEIGALALQEASDLFHRITIALDKGHPVEQHASAREVLFLQFIINVLRKHAVFADRAQQLNKVIERLALAHKGIN